MKTVQTFLIVFSLFFSSTLKAHASQEFLSNEDVALFHKQGYLLKPQCLSSEEIHFLQEQMTSLIDQAFEEIRKPENQSSSEVEQFLYVQGSRIATRKNSDTSVSIARINGVSGMQPRLLEVLRSEKMLRTFFKLLGTADVEHLILQAHPKLPGDGIAFPKHRDIQFRKSFDPEWQDVLGNGSYAICIIPIDPMSEENGGLWIDRNNYPEPQDLEEDRVWIESTPGDLLFMNPYLFHGSGPNLSSTASRKTFLTGFCAFGANHKAYPGADVNTHITLQEDGSIEIGQAPWSQSVSTLDGNH